MSVFNKIDFNMKKETEYTLSGTVSSNIMFAVAMSPKFAMFLLCFAIYFDFFLRKLTF